MNALIKDVLELKKSSVGIKVELRLKEFAAFKNKRSEDWFTEMCFCLLTANSKASTAIKVHDELGYKGFSELPEKDVSDCIRRNKHRFHNNKAKFIVKAREFLDIKWILSGITHDEGSFGAREWLVENVKRLGYKEASHYLRNIGFTDIAILDRHILNLMLENDYLKETLSSKTTGVPKDKLLSKPKTLSKKKYYEIEEVFKNIAEEAKMNCAELDLYMWCLKAGDVLR